MGSPHGKNASQDAHRLRRLLRPHPRKPRREHGISHGRAQCIEKVPARFREGCAERTPQRDLAAQPILLGDVGGHVSSAPGRVRPPHLQAIASRIGHLANCCSGNNGRPLHDEQGRAANQERTSQVSGQEVNLADRHSR